MTKPSKWSVGAFCTVIALALIAPTAMGKKPEPKSAAAAITQMEMDNVKADVAGDSSWMTREMADDYTMGTSWGAFETKQELINDAADTAKNKTNQREISDLKVRVYGQNTAIATFRESYDLMIKGEHRSRKILTTDTWVKQNGTWKLAASHSSQADQKIGD
jgi:Domain of unknown function (DUF4440)